jgi:hypothetical protein
MRPRRVNRAGVAESDTNGRGDVLGSAAAAATAATRAAAAADWKSERITGRRR